MGNNDMDIQEIFELPNDEFDAVPLETVMQKIKEAEMRHLLKQGRPNADSDEDEL